MLEEMEGALGENHSGELRRESAEAKAEHIINEELRRLGWAAADLSFRRKSDPTKLAMADLLSKRNGSFRQGDRRAIATGQPQECTSTIAREETDGQQSGHQNSTKLELKSDLDG